MKRIILSIGLIPTIAIYSILSFQARERNLDSVKGAPLIELIDGIRITTSSFYNVSSEFHFLSFRLTKEQVQEVQEELNKMKLNKRNYLSQEQSNRDSLINFDIDIMANKTAYKMTVSDNLEVVIDKEDTYFSRDDHLVRLLLKYVIEHIYNMEKE